MKKSTITLATFALIAMVFTACAPSKARIEYDQEYNRKYIALTQATYDSLRAIYERDTIVMVTLGDKAYKTVMIGTQVWMAENLNMEIGNSVCYENNEENCNQCGRLYDKATAMQACPSGWELPRDGDYMTLENDGIPPWWEMNGNTIISFQHGGGLSLPSKVTGADIRSKNGWNNNGNGNDKYGFSVLPCGALYYTTLPDHRSGKITILEKSFRGLGSSASFWFIGPQTMHLAHYKELKSNSDRLENQINGDVASMFSVRCVQEYPKLKYTPPHF